MEPTVFAGVTADMRIAREEIFGPVVTVMRSSEEDEAIDLAMEPITALAAAVWTSDIGRGHRVSRQIDSGTVWINTYGPTDARLASGST